MKSTTPPTSRKTACTTTPATWRWCAAISPKSRWCCRRRRRRSRPRSMRGAAAIRGFRCRSGSAASACRRSRRSICARERPPRGRFIAPTLAGAIKTALERKEQALLFLNRRGYAPLTLCRACGFRFSCPNCDAWLVDHRFRRMLVCHHCGFAMPHPANCPKCQAVEFLRRRRAGRRAARRRSARIVSAGARAGAVVRSRRLGRAHARGIRRHRRRESSTSSSARSSSPKAIISRCSISSASSTPISASPTAIRAPPSAPSSFCIRWSAAPAAMPASATAFCRPTSPSIR